MRGERANGGKERESPPRRRERGTAKRIREKHRGKRMRVV